MTLSWTKTLENLSHLLTSPGRGVFAIHAGKTYRQFVEQTYYQTQEDERIKHFFLNSLKNIPLETKPLLLGICSDTGAGIVKGSNWGPLFIRQWLLQHYPETPYFDLGDIFCNPHLLDDSLLNEETKKSCHKSMYPLADPSLELPVSPLSQAYFVVNSLLKLFPQKKIFALGGDHSISYPIVKAYLENKKKQNKKVAIIHFDAHTDLLSSRLGISHCFGSWAYHILPFLDSPDLLIQLGIRSSQYNKTHWETTLGVSQFWAFECENNIAEVKKSLLSLLEKREIEELYISFDIDALDAQYASATGTPEKEGLSPYVALDILHFLQDRFLITGADLVEVAPFSNPLGYPMAQETTLALAASLSSFLIGSLFVQHPQK